MSSYKDQNIASAVSGDVRDCRQEIDPNEQELRMWLIVRKDLPIPVGKFAAQAGHAFGTCIWLAGKKDPKLVEDYIGQAQSKVSVYAKSETELLNCIQACKEAGLTATVVTDAARTFFDHPTLTVGAVGPCYRDQLPKKVQRLQLFHEWENAIV